MPETVTADSLYEELVRVVASWNGPRDTPPQLHGYEQVGPARVGPGDVVVAYSRGSWRRGLVISAGPKRVTWCYVTQGGLEEARRYGNTYAKTTERVTRYADGLLAVAK